MSESKYPPRVFVSLDCLDALGEAPIMLVPKYACRTEYISISEHDALLREAWAQAFEEIANHIMTCPDDANWCFVRAQEIREGREE